MNKKLILSIYCVILATYFSYAENYFAYIETFGNPGDTLVLLNNPPEGVTPHSITDNPIPITFTGVSNRTAVNYGAQPGIGAGWNLSAQYCNEENYGRYGIISSNIFDSAVPISSKDNTGNGFFAFFRRYTGYSSILRTFVPADRIVAGEKYTFSGWAANGYGDNVENCEAASPDFKIRLAHFPSNISEDGKTYDGTWNRSDLPTVFNSSTWTSFTKEAPMAAEEGKGMLFEINCNITKSSIVLLDSLSVYGKRPVISGSFVPFSLSSTTGNSELSEIRSLSCNHAGSTPITLTISGDNAANFTVCDVEGKPLSNNTFPKTGGNYRIRFTPDGSESEGNYQAILTINAATNPRFGAADQLITLKGTDTTTTGISYPTQTDKSSILPSLINNELIFINANTGDMADISILDVSGRQIAQHPDYSLTYPVNVSELSSGTYIVKLSFSNKANYIHKVIKR